MKFKTRLVVDPDSEPEAHALYALGRLDARIFPDDEPIERVDFSRGWWWIVYAGVKGYWIPVAYCGLARHYRDRCRLSRAGVLYSYRGYGLQRRMIRTRERRARALGMKRVLTYTLWDNTPSSNNLIRCGYKLWKPGNATKKEDGNHLNWFKDL